MESYVVKSVSAVERGGLRWSDQSPESCGAYNFSPDCVRLQKGFITLTLQIPQKEQTQGRKNLFKVNSDFPRFTFSPSMKQVKLSQEYNELWKLFFLYSFYYIMCWKSCMSMEYCWVLLFFVNVMLCFVLKSIEFPCTYYSMIYIEKYCALFFQ